MLEKPLTLFHASTAKDIHDYLEPRKSITIDGEEGSFVFAGEDYLAAHAYALKSPDMLCIHFMHMPGLSPLHACIIKDRETFMKEERKGRIYEVPSDTFRMVLYKGHQTYEWVSDKSVPVYPQKITDVTFEDAMSKGIQVFFASKDADNSLVARAYDQERKSFFESNLYSLLQNGELFWENQSRGIDPISDPSRFLPNARIYPTPPSPPSPSPQSR